MNKDVLQRLDYLASLVFDDKEYKNFINFIVKKLYTNAKIIIEKNLDKLEIKSVTDPEDTILYRYQKAEELDSLVTDLIIEEINDREKESRQTRATA